MDPFGTNCKYLPYHWLNQLFNVFDLGIYNKINFQPYQKWRSSPVFQQTKRNTKTPKWRMRA